MVASAPSHLGPFAHVPDCSSDTFFVYAFYHLLHRQMPGVDCICTTPHLEQYAASCQRIIDIEYIQQHF